MEEQRHIRKSAFGRTDLFLPDSTAIFREVRCMGGIIKRDTANVYHVLDDAWKTKGAACWHCCERIDNQTQVIPLPRVYDASEQKFHVYGRTCSPGCAKAYILEHTTFDRGQHLNVLNKMLREVFGVVGEVFETPPRPALRLFGGVFDPGTQPKAECRLLEPPFISYCMIVEERMCHDEIITVPNVVSTSALVVEDADTFDEPQPPAMFQEYLERQEESVVHNAPPKRRRDAHVTTGPMTKWCRNSK